MLDHEVIEKFKEFQTKTEKYEDLNIEDVRFEKKYLYTVADFPSMTRITGGTDISIAEYENLADSKKNYFALVSGTVENNQISGYIHKDRLSKNSLSKPNVVSWTRINGEMFFIQEKPVCTNDDSFIMDVKESNNIKYIRYATMRMMKAKSFHWGNKAGKNKVKDVEIPVPKDLNEKYTSIELQKIIVEFLEDGFNWLDGIKSNIDKQNDIYKRLRKSLIPSTFKRDYVKVRFAKYAKKHNIDFNITDVEFEINNFDDFFTTITPPKKIKNKEAKKVGKHPVVSQSDGLINGYTNEKEGLMEVIDSPIILFGDHSTIVKYIDFNFFAGADGTKILKSLENILPIYAYYQTLNKVKQAGYQRHFQYLKQKKFLIPKSMDKYSSVEIQKIIAGFINEVDSEIELVFDKIERAYDGVLRYKRAYLARTFSLIDWSK